MAFEASVVRVLAPPARYSVVQVVLLNDFGVSIAYMKGCSGP